MTSNPSVPFGQLLRRARQAAGLTQEELAERAGLSRRGIADLEGGARRRPRKDTVALLATALGLSEAERVSLEASARGGMERQTATQSDLSALPSGTVTFLFTDLEGSTLLLQRLGAARYAEALETVQRLLRAACAQHKGHEVDVTGDGSFFAFAQAPDAVAAAAQAQRAITAQIWPDEATVRVRMGLHTGTAQVAGDHYIGLDVHRAARIAAAGHGGQTLLSWATRALTEADLLGGVTLRELGAHRLKDLQRPEHLSQLVLPDLPNDFPPLNSLDAHPHNLPIQLTSFVGREREVAELRPLLVSSRLLTLTGPGGIGKTRLAMRLAAEEVELFAAGVWLVELAPLADPALVPHTVSATLGAQEQPGRPILDALRDFVRAKALLLLLDNCEHLIDACAQLAEALLRAAPSLRILASSREAFGIAGETAYRVPSLPAPDPAQPWQPPNLESLARNDCVRLFVERATAAHASFRLTTKNAPAIVEIGRRLDGIPLALELAAARTRVVPPEQLAAHLDDRFRLLTGGSRTALPRHQTLLALIEWSHELLTAPERVLLRRLSVFAGGWSLDAAQAVGGDELGAETLETLVHLAEKSLVDVDEDSEAAEGRYQLLETIRQYARDKLLASGESEQVRDRHLAYCIHFAEEAEPHLRHTEQLAWLEHIEREHDNLRAALGWALESGQQESALRLAGALAYFWESRGYVSEGYKWLDEALARSDREQSERAAMGEPSPLTSAETAQRAKALVGSGMVRFAMLSDPAAARRSIEAGFRLWRELGDKWGMAVALGLMGLMLAIEGDIQTSLARVEEGVALAREVEDRWPLAMCLIRLGDHRKRTDLAAARQPLEEGVALARKLGDRSVLSEGLRELGELYAMEGDLTAAARVGEEALAEARAIGSTVYSFIALSQLAFYSCLQNDPAKAKRYCFEAWALGREMGSQMAAGFVLGGFGVAACFGGQLGQGVLLVAAFDAFARQRGMKFNVGNDPTSLVIRQALEKARAQLDPAAFEAAWTEGQQMTLEQALALATENESEES
jgi:predicted ATPase/class 3 adenylate cyclase